MIYIKSFKTLGSVSQYDEVWAIVRSAKNLANGMKQVADLSPSTQLFYKYLDLKKEGNWNEKSFQEIYVPQFLLELKQNSAKVHPLLNYLYNADKSNKKIALICFCEEENLCHRSIIAGLLQGVGTKVSCAADYSAYYTQYKNTDATKAAPQGAAFRGEKYFLSNMYPCRVRIESDDYVQGKTGWQISTSSAENAYQAAKAYYAMCEGKCSEETLNAIICAENGFEAKKLSHTFPTASCWHDVNMSVMKKIIKAKFTQNPELLDKLKAIKGNIVESNTWNDKFWGTCNGKGENNLGKLLMQMRDGTL